MESHSNDDRQNDDSRNNTRESRDALHDDGSAAGTSQQNNPGATSDHFSEDGSVRLNPDEIRNLCERNEELEERITELERRSNATIGTLTRDVDNLTMDNVQLENKLIEQKPQIVPPLRDKNKREELRIYNLNNPVNGFLYYVIHRQKGTIKEAEKNFFDKHPQAEFKGGLDVPNSVTAYNYIQEKWGIVRNKNYFNYDGDFEEFLQQVSDEFLIINGKGLSRPSIGELSDNL